MSIHCFYHSADLDGHCSGAIVKHFVPETILHPINYGDAFPWDEIKPEDTVYMVDFCLQPFEDMERLAVLCKLIWIDHHKTSIEEFQKRPGMCGLAGGYTKIGVAGCELTWDWFSKDPLPVAVTLLGRYDVWDHSDPRALPFQYRMRMEDLDPLKGEGAMGKWKSLFLDDGPLMLGLLGCSSIDGLIKEGELLLRYEEQQNVKVCRAYAFETLMPPYPICDSVEEFIGDGYSVYSAICLNRGMTSSKVFDSIYDPEKHHLMITFCRLPLHKQTNGGWTVSLYSTREDVDCGAIAKMFGGGGHKGASGFQCNALPFQI